MLSVQLQSVSILSPRVERRACLRIFPLCSPPGFSSQITALRPMEKSDGDEARKDKGTQDMLPSYLHQEQQTVPIDSQSHVHCLLVTNQCSATCKHHPGHHSSDKGKPWCPSPTSTQQRNAGVQCPDFSLFDCVSQRMNLKPAVSQGKTRRSLQFRFGTTARTRLLTHLSMHALGKSFSLFIPWLPCLHKQEP